MPAFGIKQLSSEEIYNYLTINDKIFTPPLSTRIDVNRYSYKLHRHSVNFCAHFEDKLVGLIACYFNDPYKEFGFISSSSVIQEFQGRGIASILLSMVVDYGIKEEFKNLKLKVNSSNLPGIRLYEKFGFIIGSHNNNVLEMVFDLKNSKIPFFI